MPSEDERASGQESPSQALVDALRALVREELRRPAPSPVLERPPTWQDGFWLLVLVVNVVLFAGLIPNEWWKNPALEILGKILPWLGGGTFVLGVTWFREHLLAFSRSRTSKLLLTCGMVPLLLLHIRFVPLRPKVDPPGSHFYLDGILQESQKGGFQGEERIWLKLTGHTFRIQPHDSGSTKERAIGWSWTRLIGAGFGNNRPQWALIYPLTIVTDGPGCTVQIRKSDPKELLDTDFYDERLKRVADSLEFEPKIMSETVELPAGTYEISAKKTGCQPLKYPDPVAVPSDKDIDFGKMKC